ncbi:class I SAM-dependent methyltransferase [Williamsia herbipolensis]|uniref:class I SAM-dependent methyltransferase n=1 Tax=Williamsia herbipolensis TaxID=1603258 RepID=UPI0005F7EC38|nr:class I SAM-dependent methyltransferase [Williamsia herbipolensis]
MTDLENAYDAVADSYVEIVPDASFEADSDLRLISEFVEMLPGREVLDAGCGGGRMITHLESLNDRLVIDGVDLSPRMVDHARRAHPTRRIRRGNLTELPYPDSSVDGVLGWYSIIHTLPDALDRTLREFARVLRPGGVLLTGFQAGDGPRVIAGAYGCDVTMPAHLHRAHDVAERMRHVGLLPVTVVERAPRSVDAHPQGFVLARHPGSSADASAARGG